MIQRIPFALTFILTFWLVARVTFANDYHFSNTGNDLTGDGSLANPWQTIDKFNLVDLDSGDNVYFHAGDTFIGKMVMDSIDSATDANGLLVGQPIKIGSYGAGSRPIMSSPNDHGLQAMNVGGIEIRGLEFAGKNALSEITDSSNTTKGMFFENSQSEFRQEHIYIDDVLVHGFGQDGINLNAMDPRIDSGGFRDVRITNSEVHTNGRSGIVTGVSSQDGLVVGGPQYDYEARAHADVWIAYNIVHNTTGKDQQGGVSGNGIVIPQVHGAVIEKNVAHHNGGVAGGGGVGIWTWEADNVVIQFNEAYENNTFDGRDGGGFDLDGGVRNSVMQYNYSHGNFGAGLGLFDFGYSSQLSGNSIRYNISEADGGGISIWGNGPRFDGTEDIDIAGNSIYHNNTIINPNGPAVHFFGSVADVGVYNNILVSENGHELVKVDDWDIPPGTDDYYTMDFEMLNNVYWSGSDPFVIDVDGTVYSNLQDWATATGQEMLGGNLLGMNVDPGLAGPFTGGVALNDPTLLGTLGEYRLLLTSALINAGVDLTSLDLPTQLALADVGLRDYFGGAIPLGSNLDIGAHETPEPTGFCLLIAGLTISLWTKRLLPFEFVSVPGSVYLGFSTLSSGSFPPSRHTVLTA